MAGSRPQSNFTHLKAHEEQFVRLATALRGELVPQDREMSRPANCSGADPKGSPTIPPVCRNDRVRSPAVRMRREPHQAPERR